MSEYPDGWCDEWNDLPEDMRRFATHFGPTDAHNLLLGPPGSGKGYLARILHELSSRSGGPFVQQNCGGLHGIPGGTDFVRTFEGSIHRRDRIEARAGRGGSGRHAVSRRIRRTAGRDSGDAPAYQINNLDPGGDSEIRLIHKHEVPNDWVVSIKDYYNVEIGENVGPGKRYSPRLISHVSPVQGGARFVLHVIELDPGYGNDNDDLGEHPVEWFHNDSLLPFHEENPLLPAEPVNQFETRC